jgi:hypothetical protein
MSKEEKQLSFELGTKCRPGCNPDPLDPEDSNGNGSIDPGEDPNTGGEDPMAEETQTEREGQSKHIEREFETAMDEFFKSLNASWGANVKRTYDDFMQESLQTIREMRTFFSKYITDAQQHDNVRQNIANQSLQNSVETANMVAKNVLESANMTSKQAVRHSDLAIDRQWNIDEQGYTAAEILRDTAFKEAILAAVANAVNAVWAEAAKKED